MHSALTWIISVILGVLCIRAYSFVLLSEEDKARCLKTETWEEYVARRVEVTGWGTLRDSELNSLHSSDISALMHALVVHICTYAQQVKWSSLSSISVSGNIISANQVVLHCHYWSLLNSVLLLHYHIPRLNVSQNFNLLLTSQNMIVALY
jgi:hypothetical protein